MSPKVIRAAEQSSQATRITETYHLIRHVRAAPKRKCQCLHIGDVWGRKAGLTQGPARRAYKHAMEKHRMVANPYYKPTSLKHKHSVIARALAAAGYLVQPGIVAGRPLARIVRKAGAAW